MKSVLLMLLSLNIAFATTYNFVKPNIEVNIQSGVNYELTSEMTIDIVHFTGHDFAFINVNGVEKQYDVKKITENRELGRRVSTFKVILNSEVLIDQICDEREEVKYVLTFDWIVTRGGASIRNVNLNAEIDYTYDWCHSPMSTTSIEYLLN
jgi:hypothetical protein